MVFTLIIIRDVKAIDMNLLRDKNGNKSSFKIRIFNIIFGIFLSIICFFNLNEDVLMIITGILCGLPIGLIFPVFVLIYSLLFILFIFKKNLNKIYVNKLLFMDYSS